MTEPTTVRVETSKEAKKKYKSTVNLPKTDFPMKAGLREKEPARAKRWAEMDLYGQIRKLRAGAEARVLHDGPPYANGDAHTGTGMNKILKDMVVKYFTMNGYDSPYIPGWDCHGLPIEHNVIKKHGGKLPEGMTPVDFRRECLEYANSYVEKQREQFKTTGTLGRWDDPYLTTSPRYESNVLRVFKELYEQGYVVRAKRPVHWSWAAQSALAEAELEYEEREDVSIYLKMKGEMSGYRSGLRPVSDAEPGSGEFLTVERRKFADLVWGDGSEPPCYFVIWTTTPWTMPANLAVAVNKDHEYGVYDAGDERWILATRLAPMVLEAAGKPPTSPLMKFEGKLLEGFKYKHPLWKTECPVVLADYVTLEDGTGLVHTAPGHGKEDFDTGKAHDWFGVKRPVCPVSPTGHYYKDERLREELELPDDFDDKDGWLKLISGKHIFKANDGIVDKLREQGLLLHSEKFKHSYPHCWRTHTPVIFRATEQWFVNVDHTAPGREKPLRAQILDEIKKIEWFPAWGEKRISNMVESRPDWCISRQRNWGIPIPAFSDLETGKVCMSAKTIQRVIDLVAEHGSNVWYDDENWPVEKLLPDEFRPGEFKGRELTKMNDIFDVWFEAGASHRAVMLADPELQDKFPARLYLEGDDQHRGWFQVSLILSVATQGRAPFEQCLTSAFVVDEKGEKASKSKGNIWAIDKGCRELGADLIRFYFASSNTSEPIPVTYDLIRGAGDGYRKIRNTFRTLVGNLYDFEPEQAVAYDDLLPLDRWILSRAAKLIEDVTAAWERYEFHHAMRALLHFCTVDLSSQYIDVCKDRLYCEAAASPARRAAQTAYWLIADLLTRLLAPVCVHTADEMWEHLPGARAESVHLADWPKATNHFKRDETLDQVYHRVFKVKAESDRVLDRMRKDKVIGKGYDVHVTLGLNADLAASLSEFGEAALAETLNVSGLATDTESDHATLQEFAPAEDVPGLWVKVVPMDEAACVRCFRRTGDVGAVAAHEHLCQRCVGVVEGA